MTDFNRTTLINTILTCLINQKLSGAASRALDFFFFILKYFFFMSQHLILKCFLHDADFRDACTQQHFHDIARSLRKSRHFLDIKHK